MALLHYTARVKDGLILELPGEAEQLHLKPGDRIDIQINQSIKHSPSGQVNEGMLTALREIADRQKGQPYTDGSNTNRMLREARSGAMWGYEPIE
jgi:hypothetical protein